jgi:hypothetical protein
MLPFVPLFYRIGILGLDVTALCVGVLKFTVRDSAVPVFTVQNFAGDSVDFPEAAQSAAAEEHFVNNGAVTVL